MRPGDLDGKPYARHWNPEMGPMQEQAQQALLHGVEASELGFPLDEADQLLEPGYLPLENGFTRLKNGQVFVSVLTRMPGVHGRMIDWWFGWHTMESQRYKLWHPHAHLSNRAERMNGDDPGLEDRAKYLRNPNYVSEYVGEQAIDIIITFRDPSEVLDVSRFEEAGVRTAVCGVVGSQDAPVDIGALIHLIRETPDGCEMRSRFWLGNVAIRGPLGRFVAPLARSRFVARRGVSIGMGRDLLVHCAMEMNHLASFLPALYADTHPDGAADG
jgi:hypothetical protein